MPSDFPRSPKYLKGALVVFETRIPVPTNAIVFQYNPETVSRTPYQWGPYTAAWQGAGETQRVQQPPTESMSRSNQARPKRQSR